MSNELELEPKNNNKSEYGSTKPSFEAQKAKEIKYPKSVFFIISNEFCERFSYYGMRTILAIYLQFKLGYSETDATLIYHTFVMLCYFFPVIGAIIADSYWGKFKFLPCGNVFGDCHHIYPALIMGVSWMNMVVITENVSARTILYLSVVYAIGCITLSASSSGLWFFSASERYFSLLGLLFIAMGTGGIKPCVSSFGGDQFVLPQQEKQLQQFFSVFYFSINAGSLISTFLTPELREDVKCQGQDTCYPLAFGVPAILMIVSLIIFALGRLMYKVKKPTGNIMVDITKCSVHAVTRKISSKEKRDHWLDFASDKYSQKLINDTKVVMSLIVLFSPTIFFWSLYEQQGTSWTFQATRMNGQLGDFVIKPDQMQVVNPILILSLIPLFECIIYPILAKLHLVRTALQKLVIGGLLASLAFVAAAYVENKVQPTYEILPVSGEAQLRIINGFDCPSTVSFTHDGNQYNNDIENYGIWQMHHLKSSGNHSLELSITIPKTNCSKLKSDITYTGPIEIYEQMSVSWLFSSQPTAPSKVTLIKLEDSDVIGKSDNGNPKLRIAYQVPKNQALELIARGEYINITLTQNNHIIPIREVEPRMYQIKLGGTEIAKDVPIDFGGVYTILIMNQDNHTGYNLFALSPPNTVHILWQLPQITILTVSEIMFSITGLEFSYSQAPKSMKSVISSLWLLTDSIGNLLVVVISEVFKKQTKVSQFLIYAGMMVVIMLVFALLSRRYKYVTLEDDDEAEAHDNPTFNENEQ